MHRILASLTLFIVSISVLTAATVTGTVVGLNGKPIAGALLLVSPRYECAMHEVRSGADGGFSFEVEEKRVRPYEMDWGCILAYAPGYAWGVCNFTGEAVCITLHPAGSICGVVQDEAGKPLAGVSVCLVKQRVGDVYLEVPEAWRARFTSVTDANGEWIIAGISRNGEAEVAIHDDRYDRNNQRINIKNGLIASPLRLIARPGATVSGRVFAPDGTPASGALVCADPDIRVMTDADGRYRVTGVAPGAYYTFFVRSPAHAWLETIIDNLALTAGKETHAPDVHVQSGAVLEGDAVDAETGTPIPWVNIFCATGVSLERDQHYHSFSTDAQGHFRCHMFPGKILRFITDPPRDYCQQLETEAIPVEVHDGQTTRLTLKFQKGVTLTGTMVDEQGTPVAGIKGCLDVSMNNIDRWTPNYHPHVAVVTDDQGRFRIAGLPAGSHTLKLSPERPWLETTLETNLPATAPITVTLQHLPFLTVRGRVVDTMRQPVPGVTATFDLYNIADRKSIAKTVTAVSGDDGVYQLKDVSPTASIRLRSLSKSGYRLAKAFPAFDAGQQMPGDLVLLACPVTVHGVVRTSTGPVPGVVVVSVESGLENRAVTDATGAFTLSEQPEGTLHLVAATDMGGGVATVTDTTQDITITFTPAVIAKRHDVSLLLSLLADDAKLPQEQRLFNPSDVVNAVADVDVSLALKLATAQTPLRDDIRADLLHKLAVTDPAQAEKIGTEQLDYIAGGINRFIAAVNLGIAMAKRNPNLAEHCYALAKTIYDRTTPQVKETLAPQFICLAAVLNKTADVNAWFATAEDWQRAFMLSNLEAIAPEIAEKTGVDQLDWITNDTSRFTAAVNLGISMVKRNPNLAEHCYALAKAIYDRTPLKSAGNPVNIVTLAALLNKSADVDAILAQVNGWIKQHKADGALICRELSRAASRVSPEFFLSIYNHIDSPSMTSELRQVIDTTASTNPVVAYHLLQMAQNPELESQFAHQGFELRVVEGLGRTDPAAALDMAGQLSQNKNEALLIAAKYQPKEVATKILQEVFADEQQITRKNLARAISVDSVFAKSLYEKYAQQLLAETSNNISENDPIGLAMDRVTYAQIISRIDPREARLIIETAYATMTLTTQVRDTRIVGFPQAMCALDVNRALAMLRAQITMCKDDKNLVPTFIRLMLNGRE